MTLAPRAFYATSRRLVGVLASRHLAELEVYLARLGAGDDAALAWREAFPAFDVESADAMRRLDEEVAAWTGEADAFARAASAPGRVRWTRPLGSADVHAERLAIQIRPGTPSLEPFAPEVEEALREEPANERALLLHVRLAREEERVARLRAAFSRAPWSVAVALELAEALPAGDRERREVLDLALGGEPVDGEERARLAHALVEEGRGEDALPLARRATEEVPWAWRGWYALAAAQAEAGRCEGAEERLPEVLSRAPPRRPAGWSLAELRQRIARCRERVGGSR